MIDHKKTLKIQGATSIMDRHEILCILYVENELNPTDGYIVVGGNSKKISCGQRPERCYGLCATSCAGSTRLVVATCCWWITCHSR